MRRLLPAVASALLLSLTVPAFSATSAPQRRQTPATDQSATRAMAATHTLYGARTRTDRDRIAATGARILERDHGQLSIAASEEQAGRLQAMGYRLAEPEVHPGGQVIGEFGPADFPPGDAAYHNHAEAVAEIDRLVGAHPDLASKQVIGRTHEGRELLAIKVSDNVATDENEPEVLFTHHQHAREHLTVEMALYLLRTFTEDTDPAVRAAVADREIWLLPDLNPDGGEHDIAGGDYRYWRKNRQPNPNPDYIGTDLNRNWAHKWGCCGGSSGFMSGATYRGRAPESSPEVKAVADFVRSRVVGGRQQIRTSIDFHTYGELILWPYGYTEADTAEGLTADDAATLRKLGEDMAATNNYTPQQSSDLYVSDGGLDDWLWADQKIFNYTFEMHPYDSDPGFYPPAEVIDRETARNKAAVLKLLEYTDCPYRVIGKESEHADYCAAPGKKPGR